MGMMKLGISRYLKVVTFILVLSLAALSSEAPNERRLLAKPKRKRLLTIFPDGLKRIFRGMAYWTQKKTTQWKNYLLCREAEPEDGISQDSDETFMGVNPYKALLHGSHFVSDMRKRHDAAKANLKERGFDLDKLR